MPARATGQRGVAGSEKNEVIEVSAGEAQGATPASAIHAWRPSLSPHSSHEDSRLEMNTFRSRFSFIGAWHRMGIPHYLIAEHGPRRLPG